MDERELKLNSLGRYAKSSPLYVLEEYGHCEVPAGCGGVVLRWRNPRDGVPLQMWLYRDGDGEVFLDGGPVESSRPVVGYGEHVLAFEVTDADPAYAVLGFAALYPPPSPNAVYASGPAEPSVSVLSTADGTWKYTSEEPPDDAWRQAGYDDSSWRPMVANTERRPPADPKRDMAKYRFEHVLRLGGEPLGVSGPVARIRVRKAFVIAGGDDA